MSKMSHTVVMCIIYLQVVFALGEGGEGGRDKDIILS